MAMEYLVIQLYGPMASWGEIAVGESRHTDIKPGKSALLGLLAAALGLDRSQESLHSEMAQYYRLAIKLHSAGRPMRDYHTTQAPDSVGRFRYRSRRDELVVGRARLGTILSSREYRTDALAIVAVSAEASARWDLMRLADALKRPRFHLYLGRKSCPLAAPLDPQLIRADGVRAALDGYERKALVIGAPDWNGDPRWLPADPSPHYYWEGDPEDFAGEGDGFDYAAVQQLRRHDQPLSRQRWQFQPRKEYFWMASEGGD
jgi:CRISPR system Cascade subunit CasD